MRAKGNGQPSSHAPTCAPHHDSTLCRFNNYQTPLCSVSHILTVDIGRMDGTALPFS